MGAWLQSVGFGLVYLGATALAIQCIAIAWPLIRLLTGWIAGNGFGLPALPISSADAIEAAYSYGFYAAGLLVVLGGTLAVFGSALNTLATARAAKVASSGAVKSNTNMSTPELLVRVTGAISLCIAVVFSLLMAFVSLRRLAEKFDLAELGLIGTLALITWLLVWGAHWLARPVLRYFRDRDATRRD